MQNGPPFVSCQIVERDDSGIWRADRDSSSKAQKTGALPPSSCCPQTAANNTQHVADPGQQVPALGEAPKLSQG